MVIYYPTIRQVLLYISNYWKLDGWVGNALDKIVTIKDFQRDTNTLHAMPIKVSEFLKGATVRPHGRRLRKIWVFERKNAQFTTVLPFLGHFSKNLFVFGPFCLRKTFKQKYWSRKKNCF